MSSSFIVLDVLFISADLPYPFKYCCVAPRCRHKDHTYLLAKDIRQLAITASKYTI